LRFASCPAPANHTLFATLSQRLLTTQELVKIDRAILRIPNLAIHLQTASERDAFSFNKEDHLAPIIAMAVKNSLGGGGGGSDGTKKGSETNNNNSENNANNEWMKHQEPVLVQLLASHLGIHEQNIVDFELNLFDVQRASLGGAHSEFLHSARLDNLASCFLSLKGLIEHVQHGGLEKDADISMIAMFDHEEGKKLLLT
jgi:aspartyl aminopeptidase